MKTLGWHCAMSKKEIETTKTDPDELLESTVGCFLKAKEGVDVVIKAAKAAYQKMASTGGLSDKGKQDMKELQQMVRE